MKSTPPEAVAINTLPIDKKMLEYQNSKKLSDFWDLFSESISEERIDRELTDNTGKYFGNRIGARNALIRRDLEEAKLFITARDQYAKITCEKILQFFRTSVFSWSTGGKEYASGGNIESFKHMPVTRLEELYNHEDIAEMEALSELIDSTIVKMIEEFKSLEAVRACANFYKHRPAFGKNSPVFRDCLEHVVAVSNQARTADINEPYFQNAGAQIRQYRDMFDPEKTIPEDFKLFVSSSDKSTSQIRRDIEETLGQYLHTLIGFAQMQKKNTKNELRQDLNSFLRETGYTLESLGLEIAPTYRNTLAKIFFRRSGWELHEIAVKK